MSLLPPASTQDPHVRAFLWISGFCILAPLLDVCAKALALEQVSVWHILYGRMFVHFILLLPVVIALHGFAALLPKPLGLHVLRGLFMVSASMCFFVAISTSPISTILTLALCYPFVVVVLSAMLLGERVGLQRWSAVTLGFTGALIILRPGFEGFRVDYVFGMLTGVCYACYVLLTRKLTSTAPDIVTLIHTSSTGLVLLTPGLFIADLALPQWSPWSPLSPQQWLLMALMGIFAMLAHLCMIKALRAAPAHIVAPWGYMELVFATLFGWFFFHNLPDGPSWLGMAVITLCGLWVMRREAVKHPTFPHHKNPL